MLNFCLLIFSFPPFFVDYLAQRKERLSFSKQIEEKESKRDLNSKQIQVKLLPVSRNTKHFMSPTVSAASKISASPRKKIRTESNGDQISVRYSDSRTSCSSLNNITVDFATKLHDPKGPVSKKNVTFDPTVHIIPPVESDPLQENGSVRDDELLELECSSVNNLSESMESSETKSERENGHRASYSDEVTCDSSFDTSSKKERENVESEGVVNNVSPNLNSLNPVLPPLDTDQLILELSSDPKTNSLAPGITDYCEGEINHNPLEDGFIFDIFPDTEGKIESDFEKLHSENENLDSKEMMTTKPEQEKELIRGKESLSQHFLTSPKWIFLIFIIFCGFSVMMAINPQVRSYSLIKGSMVSEYKAAGYSEGGEHLKHWGNDFISSLFGFMSNIKVGHEWGYICFQNLTASDGTWCLDKENGYLDLTSDDSSYMLTNFETFEHNVQSGEEDVECEENLSTDESEIANETADESCAIEANVDQEVAGEAYKSEGASEGVSSAKAGNIQYEHSLDTAEWGTENQVITDPTSEKNEILQSTEQEYTNVVSEAKAFTLVEENLDDKSDLAQTETMNEMVMDSMNGKGETPRTSGNEAEIPKTDNMFSVISDSTDGSFVQTVMNISLLVLSFAVATTLVCGIKKSSTKVATASEKQDQEVKLFKNLDTSSVSAKLRVENSDVEVSCSTAISSYQKDSLDRKCSMEATDEFQSQQKRRSKKNLRRESLASSSSDLSNTSLSPSYGSFTTYGMIPSRYVSALLFFLFLWSKNFLLCLSAAAISIHLCQIYR